jgi:hypothetical protein
MTNAAYSQAVNVFMETSFICMHCNTRFSTQHLKSFLLSGFDFNMWSTLFDYYHSTHPKVYPPVPVPALCGPNCLDAYVEKHKANLVAYLASRT